MSLNDVLRIFTKPVWVIAPIMCACPPDDNPELIAPAGIDGAQVSSRSDIHLLAASSRL